MSREPKLSQIDSASKAAQKLADLIRKEVEQRCGGDSTFEQRRDAAFDLAAKALYLDADRDLRERVTNVDEVEVEGRRYRRLEQGSSATYFGRWGSHFIEEPLYREVGVHDGPTVKPIELQVGIVEHMTPDMARIVGELSADRSSRALEKTLKAVGMSAPSRAFLANRTTQMGAEIADDIAELEKTSRTTETMPVGIASLSAGLDRMAVRMSEAAAPDKADSTPKSRTDPYEREPPPPKEHHYRKAWVGSVTANDAAGNALQTWRYAVDAAADPNQLADRVAADVAWIVAANPDAPVHCIQDAAPELRALPEALRRVLPANIQAVELVDLEHLMGYLDKVVDACESAGDPNNMKRWYRHELLHDDAAIDRIWRSLRARGKKLEKDESPARTAVAAALSYIRRRKDKMRYASHYSANLPVGSGATEGTCWHMQQRVKLPGQSWESRGLRATLAIRALVSSERWDAAWKPYAAKHRREVKMVA
jgi:hypothetical protein